MTQAYAHLLDCVQLVRRSWQIRRATEGLLLALAVGVGALAALALLDRLATFGAAGRWAAALLLWGAVAVVAARFLLRPLLQRHSDDFYAALVEQCHPTLANRIINALQLGREAQPASPRLVEAIVADGAVASDQIDATRAVGTPQLRRHGLALGAALLAAIAFVILAGPAAVTSMARVLLPAAAIAPHTDTQVTIEQPRHAALVVRQGAPLEVVARTAGKRPAEAAVRWTDASGARRSAAMREQRWTPATAAAGGRAGNGAGEALLAFTFPAVESSFTFHVTAGDGRSQPITVAAEPRPRVETLAVTYRYPAYTGLAERTIESSDGHLHGLPGTVAALAVRVNKPLQSLTLQLDGEPPLAMRPGDDPLVWSNRLTLTRHGVFAFMLRDDARLTDQSNEELTDPNRYTITLNTDAAPVVGFARPGRDVQVRPEESLEFVVVAQDDYGLGAVAIHGRINNAAEARVLHEWPLEGPPRRRVDLALPTTVAAMGLQAGDRLEYWASAYDRNDLAPRPGYGESRRFHLLVLTPEQAAVLIEKQLAEYARAITELIRLQRLNRTEAAGFQPAAPLIQRQAAIRRGTSTLADLMERNAFPARTIIDELRGLAGGEMAQVITLLEGYRDAANLDAGKASASRSLPVQDAILARLEEILQRLNREEAGRAALRRIEKTDPVQHTQATEVLARFARELDQFLAEQRQLKDDYEKLAKGAEDEASGEELTQPNEAEHRPDRWKQWAKDSVDAIMKLPEGFVKDSALAENVETIFEEIEKKARGATEEIATPLEEGVMAVGTEVLEDLEIWMMDKGDSARWVMEDPLGGKFEVPPLMLPDNLQDIVGDLIEDMEEFDENADDVTGTQGGNIEQVGWDIADGPISGFAAQGKTGNQLPNESEMTGRSGDGRRGKASGQSVDSESHAREGRPTPARLTNERYEEGQPQAGKQLDPRGATGGGKMTGGGARGLQGGTPPPYIRDMQRLTEQQAQLRERAQQVARQLENTGRSSPHVNRALELMRSAEEDLRDLRYDDAARKRKTAINELRTELSAIDEAVSLSLQKAQHLPPELRQQISAGAQQALPEGYEDLVGAYYKALSTAGDEGAGE